MMENNYKHIVEQLHYSRFYIDFVETIEKVLGVTILIHENSPNSSILITVFNERTDTKLQYIATLNALLFSRKTVEEEFTTIILSLINSMFKQDFGDLFNMNIRKRGNL